ncbi:hypothetical protein SAMN05216311_11120 [Chitinophaga sp. CF418]|nr:hypothetical protein SAMN05216311_11120 [Chitinophaga sp. CF418]
MVISFGYQMDAVLQWKEIEMMCENENKKTFPCTGKVFLFEQIKGSVWADDLNSIFWPAAYTMI